MSKGVHSFGFLENDSNAYGVAPKAFIIDQDAQIGEAMVACFLLISMIGITLVI